MVCHVRTWRVIRHGVGLWRGRGRRGGKKRSQNQKRKTAKEVPEKNHRRSPPIIPPLQHPNQPRIEARDYRVDLSFSRTPLKVQSRRRTARGRKWATRHFRRKSKSGVEESGQHVCKPPHLLRYQTVVLLLTSFPVVGARGRAGVCGLAWSVRNEGEGL